jgi:hypothetical protein
MSRYAAGTWIDIAVADGCQLDEGGQNPGAVTTAVSAIVSMRFQLPKVCHGATDDRNPSDL